MAIENLQISIQEAKLNLSRRGNIWIYENDGKYAESADPRLAFVGAEGISRGRVLFDAWKNSQIESTEGGEN